MSRNAATVADAGDSRAVMFGSVIRVDRQYLRDHPHQLPMFITHQRIRSTPVGGGDSTVTQRLTLDDGGDLFAKFAEDGPAGMLTAEAHGLRWLAEADVAVPVLLVATDEVLVCDWIETGPATGDKAAGLGRDLARLHRQGAAGYGAAWPGYIGLATMDNDSTEDNWPEWFARRRLRPYLRDSRDNGALDASDVATVERLLERLPEFAGPDEPIARLHGDLWPGNVHWGTDRAWLIDPAAHGGHRETDLANLRLFGGTPHFETIVEAYHAEYPLSDGWQDRVALHQLFLLLVHTALFGSSFRAEVMRATSRYVS